MQGAVLVAMDLTPERHQPYLAAVPRYLSQKQRLPVMLDGARGAGCAGRFAELAVDGIVCVMSFHVDIPFAVLERASATCRYVFLGEYVWAERLPGSYILTDFYAGGRLAAEQVLARRRERVLLLTARAHSEAQAPSAWERGVRDVLREAGVPTPRALHAAATEAASYRELFRRPDAPDAVLSINDFRLKDLVQTLTPLGLTPGVDYDAVGCYDTPWAEAWGLTSLSVGVDRALTHLGRVLDGPPDLDVLVAPSLVCRRSSPAAVPDGRP
jgi:DNA-binding LacI/PurR family transcriptional regulator